jgi:hypothetical protein
VAKLIYVQLETYHNNTDGVAWYAYFDGEPTRAELEACFDDRNKVRSERLGRLEEPPPFPTEAPSPLSAAAGFRRYFVDGAG